MKLTRRTNNIFLLFATLVSFLRVFFSCFDIVIEFYYRKDLLGNIFDRKTGGSWFDPTTGKLFTFSRIFPCTEHNFIMLLIIQSSVYKFLASSEQNKKKRRDSETVRFSSWTHPVLRKLSPSETTFWEPSWRQFSKISAPICPWGSRRAPRRLLIFS